MKNYWKYIFFGIVLLYAILLSRFGMENFDSGYIPSFSWRIVNGQHPYADFFYKGPPVTLYFHSFFMYVLPENGQYYFIRLIVYLLFAMQVFFTVSGFYNLFPETKANKWMLMTLGFTFSYLNFSPYPWPTTDGLLFASIAFWLLSRNRDPGIMTLVFVAFFALLSALTKQSFYGVPMAFLVWIALRNGLRPAFVYLSSLLFFFLAFLKYIQSFTTIGNYLSQTSGETHLYDLFFTGLHNYIFMPVRIFAVLLAIAAVACILLYFTNKVLLRKSVIVFRLLSYISLAAAVVCVGAGKSREASRLLFDAALFALLFYSVSNKVLKTLVPLAILLFIAWSSGISLGYQFPILSATTILLVLLYFYERALPKRALPAVCLVLSGVGIAHNYWPYREMPLTALTAPSRDVSPKLNYIYTNAKNRDKYLELKMLYKKFDNDVMVAPNIPMANYIFNASSKLPADWLLPTEIGRKPELFKSLLSDPKNHVLLEKSYLTPEDQKICSPAEFSPVSWFVYTKMKKTGETRYFIIYNGLK